MCEYRLWVCELGPYKVYKDSDNQSMNNTLTARVFVYNPPGSRHLLVLHVAKHSNQTLHEKRETQARRHQFISRHCTVFFFPTTIPIFQSDPIIKFPCATCDAMRHAMPCSRICCSPSGKSAPHELCSKARVGAPYSQLKPKETSKA
jgi:hypothetical protein